MDSRKLAVTALVTAVVTGTALAQDVLTDFRGAVIWRSLEEVQLRSQGDLRQELLEKLEVLAQLPANRNDCFDVQLEHEPDSPNSVAESAHSAGRVLHGQVLSAEAGFVGFEPGSRIDIRVVDQLKGKSLGGTVTLLVRSFEAELEGKDICYTMGTPRPPSVGDRVLLFLTTQAYEEANLPVVRLAESSFVIFEDRETGQLDAGRIGSTLISQMPKSFSGSSSSSAFDKLLENARSSAGKAQ